MEVEHITMDLMLKTMKQLLRNSKKLSRDFALGINPVLLEVDEYLGSNSESVSTNLVFGMRLLVESFKSFMLCDGAIQGIDSPHVSLEICSRGQKIPSKLFWPTTLQAVNVPAVAVPSSTSNWDFLVLI